MDNSCSHYLQDPDGGQVSDDELVDVDFVCSDSCPSDEESMQSDTVEADLVPTPFTPPQDDAVLTLRGHRESVFCLSVDPLGTYIASGAQDHTAIVWDLQTGNIAFSAEGHEDSVTCVTFAQDGQILATGDMSGGIRAWRRPSTSISPWTLLLDDHVGDLLWLIWWSPPSSHNRSNPSAAVLAAGDNDGLVTLWSVCSVNTASDAKRAKYIGGVGTASVSGVFYLPSIDTNRPRLVVLYQNSELRLWDVKSGQSLTSLTLKRDSEETKELEVFCLACPHKTTTRDQELLAVGGSGVIYMAVIKYSGSTEPEFTSKCVAALDTSDGSSVEALDFSWTHPYFAFGTADGTLGIVDNAKLRFRQKWTYSDETSGEIGFTSLLWSHQEPVFFTATTHCAVIAWSGSGSGDHCGPCGAVDAGSSLPAPAPLFIWWGHQAMILDLAIIPPSNFTPTAHRSAETRLIASASDDSTVKVFSMSSNAG